MARSDQEGDGQQVMLHATCNMPHHSLAPALSLSRSLAVWTPEVRHMYISYIIF